MRTAMALALLLTACNRGPEVPTAAENRDLDSAADMLDQAGNNLAVIDTRSLETTNAAEP